MLDQELMASFWDHVEELRLTLLQGLILVLAGFLIALFFYDSFFHLLTFSLDQKKYPLTRELIRDEPVENAASQPLFFSTGISQILPSTYQFEPHPSLVQEKSLTTKLLIISPLEGVSMTFKLCLWISIACTSPFWVYLLVRFILPGLKQREKKLILPFILGSFLCLGLGSWLALQITIPLANFYLENFNAEIGQNLWSLTHYVDYIFILLLGHLIAFECCLLLLFMVHYRLLKVDGLMAKRRHACVGAFILAAFLTPPDVLTQLILALALICVYEMAIFYGKVRRLYLTRT